MPIIHISAPTISNRARKNSAGYVSWYNRKKFAEFISSDQLKQLAANLPYNNVFKDFDQSTENNFIDPEEKTKDFEKFSDDDFDIEDDNEDFKK